MPKKVLIVDDEAIITGRMSEIASREGYHPLTASDGTEAVQILKVNSVDLLLADGQMTIMDGNDLVKLVKGTFFHRRGEYAQKYFSGRLQEYDAFVERHKSTPILMMSKDPDIVGGTAKDIGALGCFPKLRDRDHPFDETQFVQTLRDYLSK